MEATARAVARNLDVLWPKFCTVDSSRCSLPTPACVFGASKRNVCDNLPLSSVVKKGKGEIKYLEMC